MVRKIKVIAAAFALAVGLVGIASLPAYAQGAAGGAKTSVCDGITAGGGSCGEDGSSLSKVITAVINILSLIVGVAAVIMIIVGGLRYVTSGGDSSKTAGAKGTIIAAIVGLVIVALAQIIVKFVLEKSTA